MRLAPGRYWTIDRRSFDGASKLSVADKGTFVEVELRGGWYPGSSIPADMRCKFFQLDDRIEVEFLLGNFRCTTQASKWALSETSLSSSVAFDSSMNSTGLVLVGHGHASLNIDGRWSFQRLDESYLACASQTLPIESSTLRIRHEQEVGLIADNQGPITQVVAGKRGCWASIGTSQQLNINFSSIAATMDRCLLELSRGTTGNLAKASVVYSSREIEDEFMLGSYDQDIDRPVAISVSNPKFSCLESSDGAHTIFAGQYKGTDSAVHVNGCSFDFGTPTNNLCVVSSGPGEKRELLHPWALRRAALPVEGAVSLTIAQSADSAVSIAGFAFAGESTVISGDKPLSAESAAGVIFKNPRLHIIRPEDRLDIIFELRNLEVHLLSSKEAEIRRIDHDAKGQIAVYFAGQHLGEQAFFTTNAGAPEPLTLPPVQTRLSGATRLVFDVVGDSRLPFSFETLLAWHRLSPSLVEAIRPTNLIKAPDATQTSIEAPFRLMLSPDGSHLWLHSDEPVQHGDRTELWHTRLVGARNSADRPASFAPAQLRAVWSPDYAGVADPWQTRLSLEPRDRKDIVTVTHDSNFTPTPVQGRTMLLSAFGAYLDLEGHFPYDCHSGVSLERWLHQATLGQDNKVLVARRGYLYPFGHRVLLITLTTRETAPIAPTLGRSDAEGAYLRQRLFIVMREKIKNYDARTDSWKVPFKSLAIDFTTTPPLDDPKGISRSSAPGGFWAKTAFWPSVDGNLLNFPVTGVDWADKPVRFSAPLLFIEYDASAPAGASDMQPTHPYSMRLADVMKEYRRSGRGTRPIDSATIAVSPSRSIGDSSVEVININFDGVDYKLPVCPDEEPQFKLVTPALKARVPALKGTLSDAENSAWFAPADLNLSKAEIFLVSTQPPQPSDKDRIRLGYGGQTEKSGAIGAPSMTVGGLSRLYGPFGDRHATAATLTDLGRPAAGLGSDTFNPGDYFDVDATICGCIRLGDIIRSGLSVLSAQMPSILSEITAYADGPTLVEQGIDWETIQLQNWPSGDDAIFVTQQETSTLVPNKDAPTKFYIAARASFDAESPTKPSATVRASLENFSAQLLFSKNGIIVKCRALNFSVDEQGHTDFKVDIDSVDLVGPFLSFIQQLESLMKGLLGDSGTSIKVSSSGVVVKLPEFNFPGITLGAFSLQNLRIGSSVELSFRSEPMRVRTNFSSAADPCLLSVGIFGGGASVELVSDLRRVVLLSASFTFGAFTKLDLYIASGSAGVLGGLIYTSSSVGTGDSLRTSITYVFYVHAFGSVTALGFITVGVDFYCALTIQPTTPSYAKGTVNVSYNVKIGFFEKSFTLTFSKQFSGSGGSGQAFADVIQVRKTAAQPSKLGDILSYNDWVTYRNAFAA
ncbi:hypothetical protein [Bradyrhizobium sp. SZCCHNRI1073]|uniref:hypothetical protein n=1 Tax=Bradyrhizobium sp. SZCCHNRI1073 TaxID=3057280 RepID=UPI002915DA4D|nr:hypothetical protein [Bradyrhizobium sp. SZCCHNRI1073]